MIYSELMNCLLNYRLIKCFCHTNKHVCVRPKIVLTKIEKEQQNTFKNLAVFVVPSWASSSVSFLFSCFCNNISWCVSTKITAINCRLPVSVNLCWPAGCVTKRKPLTEMKLFLNIGRSISMSILNHVSYYYSGRMHAKTKTHICSHNVIKNIAFWMLNKVSFSVVQKQVTWSNILSTEWTGCCTRTHLSRHRGTIWLFKTGKSWYLWFRLKYIDTLPFV